MLTAFVIYLKTTGRSGHRYCAENALRSRDQRHAVHNPSRNTVRAKPSVSQAANRLVAVSNGNSHPAIARLLMKLGLIGSIINSQNEKIGFYAPIPSRIWLLRSKRRGWKDRCPWEHGDLPPVKGHQVRKPPGITVSLW